MSDDEDDSGIFPDEITSKILTYLPAKTISRFKCVSKRWNSIICDPQFIISYNSQSPLKWVILNRMIRVNPGSESEFKSVMNEPLNVSTLSVNPYKLGDQFREIFLKNHIFPVTLINSSNGFILLSIMVKRDPSRGETASLIKGATEEDCFFVVNPITCEWVPIPRPPQIVINPASVGFVTEVGPTGVLQRFVLAEFRPRDDYSDDPENANLMCFSSETWKWEEIPTNLMLGGDMWGGGYALVLDGHDGHLLWVCPSFGIVMWDEPFNREEVWCRFIPLPLPVLGSMDRRGVDVGGGHIQCMEVGIDEVCLWRLQDYHGKKWDLVHKLSFKDVWSDYSYLRYGLRKEAMPPLFMHPYESDITVILQGDRIFCLDLGTRKVVSCASSNTSSSNCAFLAAIKLPSWPMSFSPGLKATSLKEQGNDFFKAKNFNEAIQCYSRSIALSPNALAYANRAMTYIKVKRYHESEADCTEALKLDGEYFKAYWRRAIARKELGDLKGYVGDVESAFKLKSDDKEVKKLYAEAKSLTESAEQLVSDPCQ